MAKFVKKVDDVLHLGANKEIFSRASSLRQEMTRAEKVLWKALRNRKSHNYKFRRQHPIDRFIADFYCHQAKLIIEVDGGVHELDSVAEHDAGRTFELEKRDIKVIRFTNEQILSELEKVLCQIEVELERAPHPAPPVGGQALSSRRGSRLRS
jgi:very-short-patch-repair endonuclease